MENLDGDLEEQSSVCNKLDSRHIMTVSEIGEIDLFCGVISAILERIAKEKGQVYREAMRQEVG
jgi:hypothetical protein